LRKKEASKGERGSKATATRALELPAIEQKTTTTKTLRKAGRDASSDLSWLLQPKQRQQKKIIKYLLN
jgi:hypothetical protein